METKTRRPRAAWGIMALLALPFLVSAEVAAARQLSDEPPAPAVQVWDAPTPAAPAAAAPASAAQAGDTPAS